MSPGRFAQPSQVIDDHYYITHLHRIFTVCSCQWECFRRIHQASTPSHGSETGILHAMASSPHLFLLFIPNHPGLPFILVITSTPSPSSSQRPNLISSQLSLLVLTHTSLPTYSYLQALSSFSALVQLYLRSGQLDTSLSLSRRLSQPWCRFGCHAIEDSHQSHHILIQCPRFDVFRDNAHIIHSILPL